MMFYIKAFIWDAVRVLKRNGSKARLMFTRPYDDPETVWVQPIWTTRFGYLLAMKLTYEQFQRLRVACRWNGDIIGDFDSEVKGS